MTEGDSGLELEPGKEWRITTPEGVDPIKLIHGELALSGMAMALGWNFKEIERPRETEVTPEDILSISKETFGDESYGEFALAYLDWIRVAAKANIVTVGKQHIVSFSRSPFNYTFPTFEQRLDVKSYDMGDKLKQAALPILDTMPFPFTYEFHEKDRFRDVYDHPTHGRVWHAGVLLPGMLTKERLGRFLQTPQSGGMPSPEQHNLHGTLGRAFDVLCLAAELKETVDPAATELTSDTIPYNEFFDKAKESGISSGKLSAFRQKIEIATMDQIREGKVAKWGEVVFEGEPRFYWSHSPGYKTLYLDTISKDTLARARGAYERISPDLEAVLATYE